MSRPMHGSERHRPPAATREGDAAPGNMATQMQHEGQPPHRSLPVDDVYEGMRWTPGDLW